MQNENENNQPTPSGVDFLEDDLSQVDTSMPLLAPGLYDFSVAEIDEKPNDAGDKTNLKITLKIVKDAEDTRGNVLNKGFPVFCTISLTPTPAYSKDDVRKKVAAFVQAAGGTKLYPLVQYKDKIVQAKVVVRPERIDKNTGKTYSESNEIKLFVKPSA